MLATTEVALTPLRWLVHLRRGQGRWLGQAAAGSFAGVLGLFALCIALAQWVHVAVRGYPPSAWWMVVAVLGIVVRAWGHWLRDRAGQALSLQVRHHLRTQLLNHATAQGPLWLQAQGNPAWWAQRLLDQVDALHGYLARYLPARQAAVLVPLAIVVVVFVIDWVAGLLLLLATPIIPLFMALIGLGTQAVHATQQTRQAELAGHLLERLETLPWLRRIGALAESEQAISEAAHDYRRVAMRVLRVAFLSSATLEFFSAVAIGLLAIYIGFALLGMIAWGPAPALTLREGLFILLLAPECFLPLRQLAQAHHDLTAAKAAAETLAPWVQPQVGVALEASTAASPDLGQALVLEQVGFCHTPEGRPLFQNVSLVVGAGEVLGLAGPSGSGKSTLLALMAGLVPPAHGQVRRSQRWSWLAQRPYLFHNTLRNNLLLAGPTDSGSMDDAVLLAALAAAGLPLPDPQLPQGLDTPIGDQNRGVSGGQAQRIGLARALLQQAPLWLLDEPTAALDADTRDALLPTLWACARERGVAMVVASHDPVVLARCDRVLTLEAP
ncbi:MAG: thiol reductant ABC exporter subunit CydD [Giesbergeria sp.]|uniref:thiol reductant ABC exporter subunit CydD n=1 Tax=Giesbergeria sp. TaxID=2818473 RepID=UPI0026107CC7|nr:thiol reductant ABC exporter subunit CydD [Giesbergeria sp.]MDD2609865.1 thiol reductant ABC exporter subunit CydD [Giesbergeria sp.]